MTKFQNFTSFAGRCPEKWRRGERISRRRRRKRKFFSFCVGRSIDCSHVHCCSAHRKQSSQLFERRRNRKTENRAGNRINARHYTNGNKEVRRIKRNDSRDTTTLPLRQTTFISHVLSDYCLIDYKLRTSLRTLPRSKCTFSSFAFLFFIKGLILQLKRKSLYHYPAVWF